MRRAGKGLEVPPRGSSFNTRTGLCCGVGWAPCAGGAGVGWVGAGGRPCSRLSLCVCVSGCPCPPCEDKL